MSSVTGLAAKCGWTGCLVRLDLESAACREPEQKLDKRLCYRVRGLLEHKQ